MKIDFSTLRPVKLEDRKLFDEKLAEYMQTNAGKYTEKQWENLIPKLYRQFGDTYVARAGNTPASEQSSTTLPDQSSRT